MFLHTRLALAAGLLLLLSAPACSREPPAATTEADSVSIGVRVVPVTRGAIASVVSAVGTLAPITEATVSTKVAGRIAEFPLEVGDAVTAGDLIARLEQDEFQLAVQQAEAAVRAAEARREGARLIAKRTSDLSAENIASSESLDSAQSALDVAEAGVAEAKAALAIARENLANSTIAAPFAGEVARTLANQGEWIAPGQPLLHLVNSETVEVDVTVSEKRIAEVRRGQPVSVTVDGFPDRSFSGVVHRVSPTIDPVSRAFTVTAQLANPTGDLRPGMFARVEIQVGRHENTLVVQRDALIERGGQLYAVRVVEGRAERVDVAEGYRYGNLVEVREGLREHDLVVVEGAYGIAHGAKVHVIEQG